MERLPRPGPVAPDAQSSALRTIAPERISFCLSRKDLLSLIKQLSERELGERATLKWGRLTVG
jgi:hypothetical protein